MTVQDSTVHVDGTQQQQQQQQRRGRGQGRRRRAPLLFALPLALPLALLLLLLLLAGPSAPRPAHAAAAAWYRGFETPILLYVPIFARKTALEEFEFFVSCTLSKHPFRGFASDLYPPRGAAFAWMRRPVTIDLLVVVSGAGPDSPLVSALRQRVARLERELRWVGAAYLETTELGGGKYDLDQKAADWNKGPNDVFFDVMRREGRLYERHTARYAFVQQLEADVCALREGWLAAAAAPMRSFHVVVSGSSLKGGDLCMMSEDAEQPCFPPARLDRAEVQRHLNGNALYRSGFELQLLLAIARQNHSAHSFDVALWLAAQQLRYADKLYDNEHLAQAFVMVPGDLGEMRAAFPEATYLVHVPWRFRSSRSEMDDWCADCKEAGEYICRRRLPYTAVCGGGGRGSGRGGGGGGGGGSLGGMRGVGGGGG